MTLIRNQKGSIKNEKCSFEGTVIENVTSQFSKQQLIKEATHMVDNYSCIILIFTPPNKFGNRIRSGTITALELLPPDYLFKILLGDF